MLWICSCAGLQHESSRDHPQLIYVQEGQSIQKAISSAGEGDTLILQDGVYHEKITVDKSICLMALNPGEVTITNRYPGKQVWKADGEGRKRWFMEGVDWPVHWLLVDGDHAFDYRNKHCFDNQVCGPYWSKGWQQGRQYYPDPPIYFARDSATNRLWLKLDDERDPNRLSVHFNSPELDDTTYVQKDLGAYWNQQEIVRVCNNPSEYPVTMWYGGTPDNPTMPRHMYIPKICGIAVNIRADNVTLVGLRIHMAPTVGIEVNNSSNVSIRDCYLSGYQYGINTGYECTRLTVMNCEFDGGKLISKGNHTRITENMWNHSTYVVPVRFNGTGLTFKHNYVYEGFDLFQPRGRHKNYPHVPDLISDVAFNVWQQAIDNNIEFDGVEAHISMRFHHNLVLGRRRCDMLAITTTEKGDPLLIDHNLFWDGRTTSRIMKLSGTRRLNDGVKFIHNTYFTGDSCSFAEFGPESIFENNIVISDATKSGCWTRSRLGYFFPTRYNLFTNGDVYLEDFEGLTSDPQLGSTGTDRFCLKPGSPAIDAGIRHKGYFNDNYSGTNPDLGALESTEDIESWRQVFGHCGPTWITSKNEKHKAPNRPEWPAEIDRKWGGLD
jgi:hypothetical protein